MLIEDIERARTLLQNLHGTTKVDPQDVLSALRTGFRFEENRLGLTDLQLVGSVWGGLSSMLVPFETDETFRSTRDSCLSFAEQFTDPTPATLYTIIAVRVFWNCVEAVTKSTSQHASEMILSNVPSNNVYAFIMRTQIGLAMFEFTKMLNNQVVVAMQNKSSLEPENLVGSFVTGAGDGFFQKQTPETVSFFTGIPMETPTFQTVFNLVRTDTLTHKAVQSILQKASSSLAGHSSFMPQICAHYLASMAVVTLQYLHTLHPRRSAFGRRKNKKSTKKGRNVRTGRR